MKHTWCQEPFLRTNLTISNEAKHTKFHSKKNQKKSKNLSNEGSLLNNIHHFPQFSHSSGEIKVPLGNFHLNFYLNGQLVGVSIVDMVPSMLITLYFMYDPRLKKFNFGKISILKEIELLRILRRLTKFTNPGEKLDNEGIHISEITNDKNNPLLIPKFELFRYHNLGGFSLGNGKLGYKAEFGPGQLLCPVIMDYVDVGFLDRTLDAAAGDMKTEELGFELDLDVEKEEKRVEVEHKNAVLRLLEGFFNEDVEKKRLSDKDKRPCGDKNVEFGNEGVFGDLNPESLADMKK